MQFMYSKIGRGIQEEVAKPFHKDEQDGQYLSKPAGHRKCPMGEETGGIKGVCG